MKFLPDANNHLVELLEREGAEAVVPDLLDFFMYGFYNSNFKYRYLGKSKRTAIVCNSAIWIVERYRQTLRKELAKSKRFDPPHTSKTWQPTQNRSYPSETRQVKDGS